MATTTISVKTEAYQALAKAKQKGQSFSDVILHYVRPPARTCGELLDHLAKFEGADLYDEKRMKAVREGRGRRSHRSPSSKPETKRGPNPAEDDVNYEACPKETIAQISDEKAAQLKRKVLG